jgi:acyl carrier protein
MSVGATVRAFLVDNFLYMRPDLAFSDDDHLLRKGVIDSLGVMEVIGWVEETWGFSVPPEDVTEANFGTVRGISSYVSGRVETAGSTAS